MIPGDRFRTMTNTRCIIVASRWTIIAAVVLYWSARPAPILAADLYATSGATASLLTAHSNGQVPATRPLATLRRDSPANDADSIRTIGWQSLAALDYRKGVIPQSVLQLHGKRVRIAGFVVPLDDWQDQAKEFLLVPYFGACIHMPPPPPNQMVFVQFMGKTPLSMFDPVWIEGRLQVKKVDSPYGAVSYTLVGERIIPYRR